MPDNTQSFSFSVLPEQRNQRLDVFLTESMNSAALGNFSREYLKKAILDGKVSLNEQPCLIPKQLMQADDRVALFLEKTSGTLQAEEGEVKIVAELGNLLVLNKDPNLTVHPCESQPEGTLVQRLLSTYPQLRDMEGARPGIVHRLDKDTSGLMLVALSESMRLALSRAFAERRIHKTYLALVRDVPRDDAGEIDAPIGRHPTMKTRMAVVPENKGGRPALTRWKKIWADPIFPGADQSCGGRFCLLEVEIITGRTHQVRVHLSHLGHPLLGDKVYGPQEEPTCPAPRQMLHAWRLNFIHPDDGKEYTFTAPPPEDFINTALDCAERPLRLVLTGSAGCGKSTVLQIFQEYGLPTWSADEDVARLYQPGNDGWRLLDKRFPNPDAALHLSGEGSGKGSDSGEGGGGRFTPRDPNGNPLPVDKRTLFEALKETPGLRRELETLIHPLVKHDMETFWQTYEENKWHQDNSANLTGYNSPVLVAEVPLFFEAWGFATPAPTSPATPFVVTVCCPINIRAQRLKARGLSDSDIAVLNAWQWPEEKKVVRSQAVLSNAKGLPELRQQIADLLKHLKELQAAKRQALRRVIAREDAENVA